MSLGSLNNIIGPNISIFIIILFLFLIGAIVIAIIALVKKSSSSSSSGGGSGGGSDSTFIKNLQNYLNIDNGNLNITGDVVHKLDSGTFTIPKLLTSEVRRDPNGLKKGNKPYLDLLPTYITTDYIDVNNSISAGSYRADSWDQGPVCYLTDPKKCTWSTEPK